MTVLSTLGESLRRDDRDRFVCALFAPAGVRESLFALYGFDREIGRVVESHREPMLARIRLQWWRDALPRIVAGSPPRHPIAESLAAAIRAHGLGQEGFDRLLDAYDAEIDGPPADMTALATCAANIEGSVTDLALDVLGGSAAREAGRHTAIAWWLVQRLRGVAHQAVYRRHGLPDTPLQRAGVDIEAMLMGRGGPSLASVVAEIAGMAEAHLAEARALSRDVPRAAIPALLPVTLANVYLGRLRRAGFDPFNPRVQQPGAGRLRLLINAWRGRY